MMPLADILDDFPRTTITRRRFGAPSVNRYGEVSADHTDSTRSVVAHPVGRVTLERLGLDSRRETIAIYDVDEVATVSEVAPDRVRFPDGRWFEAVNAADYRQLGGICFAHVALLEPQPEPDPEP